jgi:hypothetical protein
VRLGQGQDLELRGEGRGVFFEAGPGVACGLADDDDLTSLERAAHHVGEATFAVAGLAEA